MQYWIMVYINKAVDLIWMVVKPCGANQQFDMFVLIISPRYMCAKETEDKGDSKTQDSRPSKNKKDQEQENTEESERAIVLFL